MHECPDCGQVCDCDGEDIWNDAAANECEHGCDEQEGDDDDWDDPEEGDEWDYEYDDDED
jgi:hypothetical protein